MSNRTSLTPILADLDDVIARLRDAGAPVGPLERARMALEPRLSLPPSDAQARTKEHFRKAREYTSEALRRLKRDA